MDIGPLCDCKTGSIPERKRGGYRDFRLASCLFEFTSHGYGGYMFDGNMERREFAGYRVDATTGPILERGTTNTSGRAMMDAQGYP